MRGLIPTADEHQRFPHMVHQFSLVFGGIPVKLGWIAAMQLVMRIDLWGQVGGWSDQQEKATGLCTKKSQSVFCHSTS
jgi:hypothetical protein